MRDINLLPREYQRKSPSRYLIPFLVLLCLSVWSAIKFGYFLPLETRAEKARHLAYLKEETDRLPELEESCEQRKAGLQELQSRLIAFQEIEDGAPQYWQDLFLTLTDSLPGETFIQNFTCDNTTIVLSGTSCSDVASAEYMRNLQSSGFFTDVRMDKILYKSSQEIIFHLSCTLKSVEIEWNEESNTETEDSAS